MGVMYLWEALFFLIGIYLLFRFPSKLKKFIFLWILLVPIAASFSMPVPHALRTLHVLPLPQFLVALGIVYVFIHLRSHTSRYIYSGIVLALIIGFFIKYQYDYTYTTHLVSKEWGDGYKQLALYTTKREHQYERIRITGQYWQPYI